METCKEFSKSISMCFINYSKAFDCVDHNLRWRYLREMGVPEHLVMLLHNLYEGQKATVRTEQGCCEQFDVQKGVRQGCILSPPLFNLYSEQITRNAGIKDMTEGAGGIRLKTEEVGGRNVNNLRYADDTTLLAETAPDLKELLERVKVESLKSGLALNIKKTKVMSTEELNEFTISNEKIEVGEQFNLLGSMINRTNDCSQEVRRRLALGRASMDNLKCVWREKSITVETKVRLVRALVFSVVLYGSESWTTKKSDDKKINSFELWCWRRLLRVPWTARRRNEWVLQQVGNPESLESTMVRLRLKYYGHCNRKDGSLEKDLMMGLTAGRRKRGRSPRR